MRRQRALLASLLVAVVAGATDAAVRFGDAWSWQLAPRLYGRLSQSERMQFERAEKLFRKKSYAAAAVEFEKFIAQSPKSPVRPHALLMQGYSHHLDRKRRKAIALYTELLDFYAESVDVAVPAAYLRAWAEIENGNVSTGVEQLEALVENPDYLSHPVADLALDYLAGRYMAAKEPKKAAACWRQIIDQFAAAFIRPSATAVKAHNSLTDMYLREGRMAAVEDLLETPVPYVERHKPEPRIDYVYARGSRLLGRLDKDRQKAFLRWYKSQRDVYSDRRGEQEYLGKAADLAWRVGSVLDWAGLIQETILMCQELPADEVAGPLAALCGRLVRGAERGWSNRDVWQTVSDLLKDNSAELPLKEQIALYNTVLSGLGKRTASGSPPAILWDTLVARLAEVYEGMLNPAKDNGLAGLVDRLVGAGLLDAARRMAERMENRAYALSKHVEIEMAAEDFKKAAKLCQDIEDMDTGRFAQQALVTRADIYKDELGKYEEAIKLFQLINEPPGTVWSIIECEEKRGRPELAVQNCTELENFFESEAPKAGFAKGMIWRRAGERKKAIAAFRAVLKKYPRHQVSSKAHQMLEKYGIATGGGVLEAR